MAQAFCFFEIVLMFSILAAPDASAQGVRGGEQRFSVYLQLEGDPVAASAKGSRSPYEFAMLTARTRARGAAIRAQHEMLQEQVRAAGAQVTGRFSRVANAVRVRVTAAQLARIGRLPGVKQVHRARMHKKHASSGVSLVGAPAIWSLPIGNADGTGIRIGIIDSGIDYNHADFGGSGKVEDYQANNPRRVEPGTFPTAKVIGGFDFAGDDYNASDSSHAVPVPDPDPLDAAEFGHGTHVAGIAAGFGVLTNAETFRGAYATNLDLGQFAVPPGIAPNALLYALKVFGREGETELVTDALEWAADPNGDFDFSDRLDVVNLSLGSDFGGVDPEDTDLSAIERLVDLGCVVVVSAGNNGNWFYTLGAPAIADGAIAVANSLHTGSGLGLKVNSPAAIADTFLFPEAGVTPPLKTVGPVTGKLVYAGPAEGCEALTNGAAIAGNIALSDRGTCFFSDKILAAQAAGAVAVVVVNNTDGAPFNMGGDSTGITIPAGMISKEDGALIKAQLNEGVNVTMSADIFKNRPELVDTLSDSTSRGPGSPQNFLKPEISAPGTSVLSAKAGSGTGGVEESGTSMSSPAVAGAAALLRQLHPAWSVEDIKAALMNSAKPLASLDGNIYPESLMGAGRLQVDAAAKMTVTASAENAHGRVAVSFGHLMLSGLLEEVRIVRLTNHSATSVAYRVALSNTVSQPGITIRLSTNLVIVPGSGTATVELQLSGKAEEYVLTPDDETPGTSGSNNDPRHFLGEVSGAVVFSNEEETLRVPYYATARRAFDLKLERSRIVLPASASTNLVPTIDLRVLGSEAAPLETFLAVFQLGARSVDQHFDNPLRAAADLIAVGAASDIAKTTNLADAHIFFGIATAGPWTAPDPSLVSFSVEIDLDRDDIPDFTVENQADVADVFMSVCGDSRIPLNFYGPELWDSSVYNNNVMVLAVPASTISVTNRASAAFRYRVRSWGYFSPVDETNWIPFNAARPVLDGTDLAGEGVPIMADGTNLVMRLDWEAAWRGNQRLPQAMLLHHFGLAGKGLELVMFDLQNDDLDLDGLPDWWEYSQFGDPGRTSALIDSDQDDASNLDELYAGTNPQDANSVLRFLEVGRTGTNAVNLSWKSIAGQTYTLERSTNLVAGFTETTVTRIPATPPANSFVDNDAGEMSPVFYRIRLAP